MLGPNRLFGPCDFLNSVLTLNGSVSASVTLEWVFYKALHVLKGHLSIPMPDSIILNKYLARVDQRSESIWVVSTSSWGKKMALEFSNRPKSEC